MTRNEFLAQWLIGKPNDGYVIKNAIDMAEAMEERGIAPWLDITPPPSDLGSIPVAAFQFGPKPESIKTILTGLAQQIPQDAGIPPGSWELVFRPAKLNPAGLIQPSGVPAKK